MKKLAYAVLVLVASASGALAQNLNTTSILLVDGGSGNSLILSPASLTGNRTFTFPDANGTVAMSGSISFSIGSTLTGDGSGGSPLGINLANANSWSATQTFAGIVNTGTLDQQGAISSSTGTLAIADDASVTVDNATTSATTDVLTVVHTTTGTAANDIGTGILFRAEDDGGATENVARVAGVLTDATDANESSSLAFYTRIGGGALTETMTLNGDGDLLVTGIFNADAVGVLGNVNIDGDLVLNQAASDISNIATDVVVNDNLHVTGNADVDGTLNADGATTLNGAVTLGDNAADQVTATGNLDAANGLDVTNADLTVGGSNFTVDDATGNMIVVGTSNLQGTVSNTAGSLTFGDDIVVTGTSNLQGSIANSTGNLTISDIVVVNSGGATDMSFDETSIVRNSASTETLAFDNTGAGDINVLINGATSVTNSRLTVNGGHWTSQGTAPTAAGDGTNLAAGATVSTTATDVAGLVTATDNSVAAATGVITVTFASAYATNPIVVVTPANAAAGNQNRGFFVSNITTTTFDINVVNTVGDGTSTYSYYYQVIEND